MSACGPGGALTGIALIDTGDLDVIPDDGLDGAGEPFDLAAILGAGGRPMQTEQMAWRIDRMWMFDFLAFAAVVAGALAALGRGA